MVPSIFIFLAALPLTTNGKIDHRALPVPERARPELESRYAAPRTLSEEMLAQSWAQVLGIDQVGIHDNFFELGGHSMLAIQLMAQVQDAFQIELTFRLFFQRPTIAELAVVIDEILLNEIEYLSEEEAIQHLQDEF
jgi:acyl carrier protein